jgi:hypothetical protein
MASDIKIKLDEIKERVANAAVKSGRDASSVTLITVTKTHPAEVLQEVLDVGGIDIGENRVQEVVAKIPELTGDKTVHLIGHLQSNKVNKIVELVDWIHSADKEKIINRIDRRAGELDKKIKLLVQVNTSGEESKSGCEAGDAKDLCELAAGCENIDFRGLMTIGPLGGTEDEVRKSFIQLRELSKEIENLVDGQVELSMGMSGDFEMAISEGATMVRVGSSILGHRKYI